MQPQSCKAHPAPSQALKRLSTHVASRALPIHVPTPTAWQDHAAESSRTESSRTAAATRVILLLDRELDVVGVRARLVVVKGVVEDGEAVLRQAAKNLNRAS